MALLIPFAWSRELNRLVEPNEVANGLSCGCICPGCNEEVVAKHPKKNRISHFAHFPGAQCGSGLETAVHRAAKQIIWENRKLWVPSELAYSEQLWPVIAIRAQVIDVEQVEVEKSLGLFRPDLLVTGRKGKRLAVEVAVTNPVSEEKAAFYQRSGISALQIDLSKQRQFTLQSLSQTLLSGGAGTKWIHNEFAATVCDRLKNEARRRTVVWRQSHKRIWKVPHVDSCPCPHRSSSKHDSTFSNAKLDCPRCPFFVPQPNLQRLSSVLCSGHLVAKFPIPTQEEWSNHYEKGDL